MQEVRQGQIGQDFQQDQEAGDATQSAPESTLKVEKLGLHIAQGNTPSLCPPAPKKGMGKLVFDYANQMWVEDIGGEAGVRYGTPVKGLVQGEEVYFETVPAKYKPPQSSSRLMKHTKRGQFGKKGARKMSLERFPQAVANRNVSLRPRDVTIVKATVKKDTPR